MSTRFFAADVPWHGIQNRMKYYDKDFQTKAFQWWHSLSINEMKAFEKQYGIAQFGRMAIASEIAEIYDHEAMK